MSRRPVIDRFPAQMLNEKLIVAAHASEADVDRHQRAAVEWLHLTANAMGFRLVPMEQEAAA
jgi:hypothetical protein